MNRSCLLLVFATSVACGAESRSGGGVGDASGASGQGSGDADGGGTGDGGTGSDGGDDGGPTTGGDGQGDGDGDGDGDSGGGHCGDGLCFDVGGGSDPTGGGPDDGGGCGCRNVMDGIYLMSDRNEIWFYDPSANDFALLGSFTCLTTGRVNSMGIDRQGFAWVNFVTTQVYPSAAGLGEIWQLDLSDLSTCVDSGYQPTPNVFAQFGMAFATRTEHDTCDDLYLYENENGAYMRGANLGRITRGATTLDVIAAQNYPRAELTGTGDGRLFAFMDTGGDALLVELDKSSGAELNTTPLPGLETTNAFAFAFWGGDVYFFTESDQDPTHSMVTRLDLDGNAGGGLSVVHPTVPGRIGGAGVSTCASVIPPG